MSSDSSFIGRNRSNLLADGMKLMYSQDVMKIYSQDGIELIYSQDVMKIYSQNGIILIYQM